MSPLFKQVTRTALSINCSGALQPLVHKRNRNRNLNQTGPLLLSVALLMLIVPWADAKSKPKAEWADSPLAKETQVQLERAGKLMKSGKYDKAKPMVIAALDGASDVQKCLAIASYTEPWAYPMMDTRRQCCNKALTLCSSEDDYLLMALKARRYQFFEITRECISKLIENASTVPALYSLARKAHEVSLNDVAHMAMDKAAKGIKTGDDWLTYAENCKALGYDDLLRKAIKLLIDEETESIPLCDLALRIQRYGMRDMVRYALRKSLDRVSSDLATATNEMTEIAEAARRLNEPDVKNRAEFYMKKGNFMLKQRNQESELAAKERANRENRLLDEARLRDKERESGFLPGDTPPRQEQPQQPTNPSAGY